MGKVLESSTKKITPIYFNPSIDLGALIKLYSDLKAHLPSGAFFAPGWKIEQQQFNEEVDGQTLKGYIIKLTYNPDETDKHLTKHLLPLQDSGKTLFELALESFKIKQGLTGYIIFTVEKKAINGLATNFSSEAFRKLMFLSKASMFFYKQLELTEYWLSNIEASENKVLFDNLSIAMINYKGNINKDGFKKIFKNQLMALIAATQRPQKRIDNWTDKTFSNLKTSAYQAALGNGYNYPQDDFLDPIFPGTKIYVAQQITPLLIKNKIFPAPAQNIKKQLVLFVGEGDGLNMRAIQEAYPQFECFAIEPAPEMVERARVLLESDRIFEMTLQEFVALLPNEMKKSFNTVLVFNFNIASQTDIFVQALDYCCVAGGIIGIGVSFADNEYINSNISLADHIKTVFGENYKGESRDVNFPQKLHIAEGLSIEAHDKLQGSTTEALQNKPLAKKINALHAPIKEKQLSELKEKNKLSFKKLSEVYKQLQVTDNSISNSSSTAGPSVKLKT